MLAIGLGDQVDWACILVALYKPLCMRRFLSPVAAVGPQC